jgi:sterol desaturase/sphingolipid hydroxylase (fatty acid hydroxylase superfamily)
MYLFNNKITYYQYILISIYKTAVEIAGHTGKKSYPTSSFPQFPWITKSLNIELYTEDHDSHHRFFKYNYSKRFSLWDKVFGTYKNANYI